MNNSNIYAVVDPKMTAWQKKQKRREEEARRRWAYAMKILKQEK